MNDQEIIKLLLTCLGALLATAVTLALNMRKEILQRFDKIDIKLENAEIKNATQDQKIENIEKGQGYLSKQIGSVSTKVTNMLGRLMKLELRKG